MNIPKLIVEAGNSTFELRCFSCGNRAESLFSPCRCGGRKTTWTPSGCLMTTGEEDLEETRRDEEER